MFLGMAPPLMQKIFFYAFLGLNSFDPHVELAGVIVLALFLLRQELNEINK